MTLDQTANFVRGGVTSSIASGDTTIDVSDASIYPDPANGEYNLVLWDSDAHRRPDLDPDVEVVRATSRDTTNDILSVTRAQEGTSDVSHPSTSELQLAATSKFFGDVDSKLFSSITVSGNNGLSGGSGELGDTITVGISGTLSLDSDLEAAGGETIWDESATYVPTARLQNDSMTIAGNSVSLGGSTAINHSNISNINSDDHHAKYTDNEAVSAVEAASSLSLSGSVTLGGDLTATNGETIWDESATYIPQNQLQNDTVTIEGNAVSLGGSTSVNHNDLSTISSDDHHTKYTDSEAVSAVEAASSLSLSGSVTLGGDLTATNGETIWDESATEIPDSAMGSIANSTLTNSSVSVAGNSVSLGGSTAVNHGDLSNISSNDHHSRYSNEEAQDAVGTIISGGTDLSATYDDAANTITVSHNDTSTQGDVTTNGATVIDDIGIDGRGHVDNMNTENRSLDDWNSALDDQLVGFGSNTDFSWFYDSSTDELVLRDETNTVELIRQPKQGSTEFLQGADIGSIEAPEDSYTQIINSASTSAATSGDTVGYTFSVDNQTALSAVATADGSGGLSDGPWAELAGDLRATNGEVIWDESATYIPQGRLQNDTVTIEGNAVSLGGSTSVNHNDLSTISSDDHHSKYTDGEAITAINNDADHGSTASHNYFSGSHTDLSNITSDDHHTKYTDSEAVSAVEAASSLSLSGSVTLGGDLTATNGETIWDESATYIPQNQLQNDTVTIEGNAVSLGGSTSVNHNDLSTISSDDHHTRYSDEEAQDAVGTIMSGGTDLSVTYDDAGNSITVNHNDTSTQGNVSAAAGAAITDINLDGRGHTTSISTTDFDGRYLSYPSDDALTQLVNVSSTSSATSGDTVGYTLDVDGITALEISGTADGSGGLSSGPFVSGEIFGVEGPDDQVSQVINVDNTTATTSGASVGYTFGVDNITGYRIEGTSDGNGGLSSIDQYWQNSSGTTTGEMTDAGNLNIAGEITENTSL